jgi:Reverse transcriptase (RNA-dependent DNA polymerase)
LDKENENTYWFDALMKEMGNVRIAFELQPENARPPPGFKPVELMMIFDVKMDFARKARLVARGDLTDTPSTLTYSSVVSRESVRIAFLIAALNDLDIIMFDVGNAYLNAPTTEKLYCYAGKEFGAEEEGRLMIIVRALYGLKSSGAAYRAHFAITLTELGFKSCKVDPDVWYRAATKVNGFEYYEYLLTYVDDCLIVSHEPKRIISTLEEEYKYRLKDVGEPTRYLGAEIGRYDFSDGTKTWFMSARLYLHQAIIEVERKWGNVSKLFPKQLLDVPIQAGSHPEMDTTKFLDDDDVQLYQSYIGVLRWAVELGRVDLVHAAGMMARFSAAPRQGHLYDVLRIFAYCKKHLEYRRILITLNG